MGSSFDRRGPGHVRRRETVRTVEAPPAPAAHGRVDQSVFGNEDGLRPSRLRQNGQWMGIILRVDTERWAAYVRAHGSEPIQGWATWCSPYCHPLSGFEGVNFIPRRGAQCLIQRIDGQLFITGFYIPASGAESQGQGFIPNHRGLRPKNYELGDLILGTEDGNTVTLTSDGAITQKARALAQSILSPRTGLLKRFLRNLEHHTDGGFLEWLTRDKPKKRSWFYQLFKHHPEEDKDDQVRVTIGKVKEKVETVVEARKSDDDDRVNIKVLKRTGPGESGLTLKWEMNVDHDGNVEMLVKGNVSTVTEGDVKHLVKGDYGLEVEGAIEMTAAQDYRMSSDQTVHIDGQTAVRINEP